MCIRDRNGNTANGGEGGAGIYSGGGTELIVGSTIANNVATGELSQGGAIRTNNSDTTIINSTISGNSTNGWGGAFSVHGTTVLTVRNSTVTGNSADADENGSGTGGALSAEASITVIAHNSIFAGNFRGSTSNEFDASVDASSSFLSLIHI